MNKYQESFDNIKREVGTPYFSTLYDIDDWKKDISNLQELVDKEKPMKPAMVWEHANPKTRCKCSAGIIPAHNYCWNCGQKLDWSDSNERD